MLGFTPVNIGLFKLAFSHKSNNSEKSYGIRNNERLEYLGDAVLGTIVAEYLFKKYPSGNEGFLTKMRSKIVRRKSLNHIGDQMGLDMLLSEFNTTKLSKSMLGNAVEALVGAVYMEKGYRATKRFVIQRILRNYIDIHNLEELDVLIDGVQIAYADDFNKKSAEQTASSRAIKQLGINASVEEPA